MAHQGYDELAQLAKAVAHPTRLRILDILAREEACVCHLAAITGQRQSNVSQHLSVLREANLVQDRRDGLMVYYRLADMRTAGIVALLRDILAAGDAKASFPVVPDSPVAGCKCPRCSGGMGRGE